MSHISRVWDIPAKQSYMKLIRVIIFVCAHLGAGCKTLQTKLDLLAYVALNAHPRNCFLAVRAFVAGEE